MIFQKYLLKNKIGNIYGQRYQRTVILWRTAFILRNEFGMKVDNETLISETLREEISIDQFNRSIKGCFLK